MTLDLFLNKVRNNEPISFDETMAIITNHYAYRPTEFSNGFNEHRIVNTAGVNEGSCKIFSFARLHRLSKEQTLNLFGDYYRLDVLQDPDGRKHANIRNFIRYGWDGIEFSSEALTAK